MKLAFVTGSSSGLGKALIIALSKQGYECICFSRNEGDLATEKGRETALEMIRSQAPDLIINNAGFGIYGKPTENEAREMVDVNVKAVMELTYGAIEMFLQRGKPGVIVNISSVASLFPTPGMTLYGATKAFVTSFSEGLDQEYAHHQIRILTSLPGQIATPFASKAAKKEVKGSQMAMSPDFAAKEILWQIKRRKRVHIFDFRYKLFLLFPKKWLSLSVERALRKRR